MFCMSLSKKCGAFPAAVSTPTRIQKWWPWVLKQSLCTSIKIIKKKKSVYETRRLELGRTRTGEIMGIKCRQWDRKKRMWKITLYLSVFLRACPAQDCHHIAGDWISRKSWLLTFFSTPPLFALAVSDSDNVAFDKNPITYIWLVFR